MRALHQRLVGLTLAAATIATPAVAVPLFAAADSARLPRTDFPACSATVTTYCISSVSFFEAGVEKVAKWIPTGTAGLDAAGAANAKTYSTFGTTATNFTGRWSYDGFPFAARDFDGIYVDVEPANEFTDTMVIRMSPAGPSAAGQVGLVKSATTGRTLSLPADMGMKVTLRLGDLNPAVTMAAGNEVSINNKLEGAVSVFTFQGLPVAVPTAGSSKDCDTSTSVAVDNRNQLFAYVAFKNGRDPFGVDGLSGDMLVSSNGFCKITTPTWNTDTKSMEFTASAPHFAPDGTTVNNGFYRATIPAADAALLFGIADLNSTIPPTTVPTSTTPAATAPGATAPGLASTTTTTLTPATTTSLVGQRVIPVTPNSTTTTTILKPVNNESTVGSNGISSGAAVVSTGVRSQAFLAANKSLTLEVKEATDGSTVSAARNVAFDGRNFTITATGFTFSTKTITMSQGLPPNAPQAVASVSVKRSKKTVTAKFAAAENTTYYILVQRARAKASKTACSAKSGSVTCTAKNLPKGSYTVKVTPVKDGMIAPTTSKKVAVP